MEQAQTDTSEKKPYAKPELTEYGPVTKLTAAKSGTRSDGQSGMQMDQGMGMGMD
jgi:hypothetical protein